MKVNVPTASQPKPVRLPARWPHEISCGDVTVKIYRTPTKIRGKTYRTYTLSYFANGKRQRRQFTDFTDASTEAKQIAEQKAQGALGAAALSPETRIALQDALVLLAKTEGTGQATAGRLIEIVRDYAQARAELPKGASLTEAVQFYAKKHPSNMIRKSVAEVAQEFIGDRRSAGCSEIHLHDLNVRLAGHFAKAFAQPINTVSVPLVHQWLSNWKNQNTKKAAAARTKRNMLRQVVALFNYARRMKFVTPDLATEVSEIQAPKKQPTPIGIYTPKDIEAILGKADDEIKPAIAIAAFAGLRLAEVSRLDWRDIRLDKRKIAVEAENAKLAKRRLVPICANLAAWLAPHVRSFGPINPCEEERHCVGSALGNRIERAAARAKVRWKRNGFRHSYISYRVATLKDVPAVALECGNSPAIIFSNYREITPTVEEDGKAWFEVMPPPLPGNVINAAPAIAACA